MWIADIACRSALCWRRTLKMLRNKLALVWTVAILSIGQLQAQQVPVPVQPSEDLVVLAPGQAREAGLEAIRLNRPELANQIATALLASNPEDPFAHYLMATAMMRLGHLPEAKAAGRLAFRHASTAEQHYQSARLTALAAYQQKRFGAAQWWLRQAAQFAPEEGRRDRSIAEFNAVRRKNPVSMSLRFAIVPSDNVNNGSSGRLNVIEGVPYVGTLSPDAQALSGTLIEAGVDLGYRLRETNSGRTVLGMSLDVSKARLSRKARAQLSGMSGPDLGSERMEVSLRQSLGRSDQRHELSFGVAIGQLWQGGVEPQPYGRLNASYALAIDALTRFDGGVFLEQRDATMGLSRGDKVTSFRLGVTRNIENFGIVSGNLFSSKYSTELTGRSSMTSGAQISFAPARDIGPVKLSISFGAQTAKFPGYSLAGLVVPGGREDTTRFGELNFMFDDLEYSGFAPVLNLRKQSTHSNVSRFEASETSVTLAIRSTF